MIPFNKPFLTGKEFQYLNKANSLGQLSGDGFFSKKCKQWLEKKTSTHSVLLTNSCTAALEMAAILTDIKKGDEIIMPSYTFTSTANAFALRGGKPIFVDINPETLNIDVKKIEELINENTKAIVAVHYAGLACDMEEIVAIAKKYKLLVIEDAAQGVMSTYKGKALGSIGDLGCYSFHETKNIIAGEAGALLINNKKYLERAEYIRDKGTNRSAFNKGHINKYTWVDIGSSFLPGELTAAFLLAQLEQAEMITKERLKIWNYYKEGLKEITEKGLVSVPLSQEGKKHNGHIFYLIHSTSNERDLFIEKMRQKGVMVVFHYIPLHISPYALKNFNTKNLKLPYTESLYKRISRIPIWLGIDKEYVLRTVKKTLIEIKKNPLKET